MVSRGSSIKSDFVMLRLCSSLNQLFSKALSAMLWMVSSTGTLVKSKDKSYDSFMCNIKKQLVTENKMPEVYIQTLR